MKMKKNKKKRVCCSKNTESRHTQILIGPWHFQRKYDTILDMDSLNPVYLFVGAAAAAMAYNSDTVAFQIKPDLSYFQAIDASQPKGVFTKKPDDHKRLKKVSQKVSKIAGPKLKHLHAVRVTEAKYK
jgi:hypothetical protein